MRLDLACLALALAPAIVNAADPKPAWAPALDRELATIADDPGYRLSGISVLALKKGEIAYEFQHGRRRIDDAQPPPTTGPSARTRCSAWPRSRSSSRRSASFGSSTREGSTWTATYTDYLGWRLRNPHFPDTAITLRLLLSHNSSLRDAGGYYWDRTHRLRDALVPGGALYGEGKAWSAEAAPGRYFSYANLPWGVIAEAMESDSTA